MLVERRHLADDVITNAAGSESILCGIAAGIKPGLKSLCATQVVKTFVPRRDPADMAATQDRRGLDRHKITKKSSRLLPGNSLKLILIVNCLGPRAKSPGQQRRTQP